MKIEYELNEHELAKYEAFRDRKYAELAAEQEAYQSEPFPERLPRPYLGVIGGGVTWHIEPTSIGTGISVTILGETIDLTDIESW